MNFNKGGEKMKQLWKYFLAALGIIAGAFMLKSMTKKQKGADATNEKLDQVITDNAKRSDDDIMRKL
jgi:hypothetical protein